MRRGDAAWNPVSGEKVLVVESAEETAGRRLVLDLGVEPGGFLPGGEHVHDHLTERFHVSAGTWRSRRPESGGSSAPATS